MCGEVPGSANEQELGQCCALLTYSGKFSRVLILAVFVDQSETTKFEPQIF